MKRAFFVLIIGLIILLYGLINYYIGLRGWQGLGRYIPRLNSKVYWVVFWLIALSYIVGRLGEKFLPSYFDMAFTLTGAYWMAAMIYFLLILVLVDLIRLLNKWFGFIPMILKENPYITGIAVFSLVVLTLAYGTWNARHPVIKRYDISIAKKAGSLKELHIVAAADLHLGTLVDNGRLLKMVDKVNKLKPDLVLFAGDVIDDNIAPFVEQKMGDSFKKIRSKYGVYSVLGNHEYIGGNGNEAIRYLDAAGVKVLRDNSVKVADSFYIIGRDDLSGHRNLSQPRVKLSDLVKGLDPSKPLIVMDHQPYHLEEAEAQGIDFQLSGHTHNGQLFPGNLITRRIYEIDWGYLKKGKSQFIVTSGYGTWGPPVRVGTTPELLDITIHFKN